MNAPRGSSDDPNTGTVIVGNERGLHARAAAKIVKLAATFDAQVMVAKGETAVAWDSILGLMMLAAGPGSRLELRATGRQARAALTALIDLLTRADMEEV